MDERQLQIRERAGLEESRLNREFIEWLQKWGTSLLMVAAVAAGLYAFYQRREQAAHEKLDQAFSELESARAGGNASPDTLAAIADSFEGVGAVSTLARLEAADAYLGAVRLGVRPGAQINEQTGELADPKDVLGEQDRADYLARAADFYQRAIDGAGNKPETTTLVVSALNGLAAVEECRGDLDKAKAHYQRIVELTKDTPFRSQADVAQKRLETMNQIAQPVALPVKSQLPELPEELRPKPPTPPAAATPAATPTTDPAAPAPGTPSPESAPQTPAPTPPAPDAPKTDEPKTEPPKSEPPQPSAPPPTEPGQPK